MPSAPQTPEQTQCPICRAEISPALKFCDSCGAQISETTAQEIRNVNYLLSEIARWETDGSIRPEQASQLRADYERRREELHAQLAAHVRQSEPSTPQPEVEISALGHQTQQPSSLHTNHPAEQYIPNAPTFSASTLPPSVPPQRRQRRVLLETLADPHTIRLLLYTGAAMLVVGVVIWLRDVLYLKLQEPIVQAALLVIGTIIVTVSGWLAILRTRLLLTGRALTLMGSLLVPVNFWFLVRSGLIENHGRAWIVCAFCALLYASTAALLREKLYVYLASVASIATAWTIIYRIEREAFGLYALSLMTISLIFLHLSRLFPLKVNDARRAMKDNKQPSNNNPQSATRNPQLFRSPLVHVALFGATVSALLYMLLRFGSSPSLADGILRLRANEYDSSVAMLLFALAAYVAWFTGRYIYTDRRVLLYTAAALALFWTEFLTTDGLRLPGSNQVLTLAVTALIVALSARMMKGDALPVALHHASLIACIVLASITYAVLPVAFASTFTYSAILFLLAATFAVSSVPRFSRRVAAATLAYGSAVFASAAFLVALLSLNLKSETLFYTACASWPFALYAVARLTRRARREMQLSLPFMIVADVEFALLLLFVAVVAFVLNQAPEERILAVENLRGAMFCVLSVTAIYGALRCWLEHSFFGAMIIPVAGCLAALIALRVDAEWFAVTSVLMLFPTFFAMSKYARARKVEWLAQPASVAAGAVIALVAGVSLAQAFAHLHVGDPLLLAPCVALGAVALLSFAASLWAKSQARVTYFRAGLCATVITFAFACLRAGYDPLGNIEIYTSPVALLLLAVAYLSVRRRWDKERASETSLLLWLGSLLLCAPVLIHALQDRLLLSVPAAGRDLLTLCASLALILFGGLGRLRAPSLVGAVSLALELLALALTSVDWVQIPLKVYLISVGALILLIWGLLEFRREQILLMRQRFNKRREYARERFGEWR
jgi:hypothetical protein